MAVVSEVKCGRCDRRYSGFRSRCPYCGARRNKRGKHAGDSDNAKAKIIIGILLILVVIAATMILLFSSLPQKPSAGAQPSETPTASASASTSGGSASAVSGSDNANASAPPDASANASASPASASPGASAPPSPGASGAVTQVVVTYAGKATNDITMKIGEVDQLAFTATPASSGATGTWKSSDETIFTVTQDGKVTAVAKGTGTLTVTVGGVSGECTIRVVKGA